MSEEKKTAVSEEVKEARKLSMEELENVNGGGKEDLEKHGLGKLGGAVATPGGGASQLLN